MPCNTGIEAYRRHNLLFMTTSARAYKGPWKTFGSNVFASLRKTNRVLYNFICKIIARNFVDYEYEVLVLGLAIFLESIPGIPEITGWDCEVTSLDLTAGEGMYIYSAVKDEFFEDGLEGAFEAFTDFIRKVCRTDTLLAKKMICMGYLISAVVIHHNEYWYIQQQVKGHA